MTTPSISPESVEVDPAEGATKKRYSSTDPRVQGLVRRLAYYDRTWSEKGDSRAALAELRRHLNNPVGAAKYVASLLGPTERTDEHWFYLVASLFAHHRLHTDSRYGSLGHAFRGVQDDPGSSNGGEARFQRLVNAEADQLPDMLLNAVTWLRSKGKAINYERLLDDLRYWELPGKPRQMALCRDYYYFGGGTNTDSVPETNEDSE